MNLPGKVKDTPEIMALIESTDYCDLKMVECKKTMRELIAASLSYMPEWMRFLYRVRAVFVRLFGVRQELFPDDYGIAPDVVSFEPGQGATFFTVVGGKEETYWIAEARDKMISGYIALAMETLENGDNRHYFITLAKYRHWTGKIYFAVIKPFHHVVVNMMLREAVRV